jgi:Cu(I)-responsive transcriptional regulator
MPKPLTIGDLARETGVKVVTIRYYERIGLLPVPPRTGSGAYRSYAPADLGRLGFIRRARDLGFTLNQIRALLDLAEKRDRDCADVDAIAREHLVEVEEKIADLSALWRELRELIENCGRGTIDDCRIIDALSPSGTASGR